MADRYASLKQGLVGCWIPSVSGSGLLLPDLSGRGNNGSLVGMNASDWVSSSVGRVLNFGLYSAKIPTCKDSPTLNITSDKLSLSVFVNNLNSNEWQGCFHKCNANTPGYQLFITDANKIAFGIDTTVSGFTRLTGGTLPSGVCHLACVYDGQQMITYINGRLDTSTTKTGNITDSSGIDLFLNTSRVAQQSIVSWATDWRVYNRPLTTSEVAILSSEPGIGFKRISSSAFATRYAYKPAKPRNYGVVRVKETDYGNLRQGLVGAWCPSLPNGGSGNTLPDVSGYGNHGVLTNMGPEDWVSGQYGRALDFDGSNDYVNASNSSVLSFAPNNPFTLSVWANLNSLPGNSIFALIGKGAFNNNLEYNFYIGEASNSIRFTVAQGPNNGVYIGRQAPAVTSTSWAHYLARYDGSASNAACQIYLNGLRVDNADYGSGSYTAMSNLGAIVSIGALNSGSNFWMNGREDDIRIYSRALTESEIRLLASRPGIGLRQDRDRNTFYQFPSGARRKRILTGMP